MKEILDLMHPMMELCKIKPLNIPDDVEQLPRSFIITGYEWLDNIYKKEWRDVNNIRLLLPEDAWKRYLLWGEFEDHREVRLFNEAARKFKKVINSRQKPGFFKKGVMNGEIKKLRARVSKVKERTPIIK
jgi:hypothetical protein